MSAAGVVGIHASARRTPYDPFRVPYREVRSMRSVPLALRVALGLAATLFLCAATVSAQQPAAQARPAVNQAPASPDVHVMEIYNGSMRTVHYISNNRSPGEQMA